MIYYFENYIFPIFNIVLGLVLLLTAFKVVKVKYKDPESFEKKKPFFIICGLILFVGGIFSLV